MMTYLVTRKVGNNKEELFTGIKVDADKFFFDSLFVGEVEVFYKKKFMTEQKYNEELEKRYLKERRKLSEHN